MSSTDMPEGFLSEILKRENRLFAKGAAKLSSISPIWSSSPPVSDGSKGMEANTALTEDQGEGESSSFISQTEEEIVVPHPASQPNATSKEERLPTEREEASSSITADSNSDDEREVGEKNVDYVPQSSAISSADSNENLAPKKLSEKEDTRKPALTDKDINKIAAHNDRKVVTDSSNRQIPEIIDSLKKQDRIVESENTGDSTPHREILGKVNAMQAKEHAIEPEKSQPQIPSEKEKDSNRAARKTGKDNLLENVMMPKVVESVKEHFTDLGQKIEHKEDKRFHELTENEVEQTKETANIAEQRIIEKLHQTQTKKEQDKVSLTKEKQQLAEKNDPRQPHLSETGMGTTNIFKPGLSPTIQSENKIDSSAYTQTASMSKPLDRPGSMHKGERSKEVRLTIGNINIQVTGSAANESNAQGDAGLINTSSSDSLAGWNNISNKTYYWKFRYV